MVVVGLLQTPIPPHFCHPDPPPPTFPPLTPPQISASPSIVIVPHNNHPQQSFVHPHHDTHTMAFVAKLGRRAFSKPAVVTRQSRRTFLDDLTNR